MYKKIRVKAPAKINLTLEILNKREDGYHNIKSIMQAISLYDYLTFSVKKSDITKINLNGNSDKIPYNEKNLVYKAIDAFFNKTRIRAEVDVFIEKNIPVEAGLAGGSTDGAAALYAMNMMFDEPLDTAQLDELCASLGSDLNFCLHGGTALCTGRGENIQKIDTPELKLSLVKPLNFGISAKEAYTKFSLLPEDRRRVMNYTEKMAEKFDAKYLFNSFERALTEDYPLLGEIKRLLPNAVMSGSGPTFFILQDTVPAALDAEKFLIIEGLESVTDGVQVVC